MNSLAIANMLKTVLKTIISKMQTGFLRGRFIGENACFIYDILHITGITFNNVEIKLSQYADDTTLVLDGSRRSLMAALNTLETYVAISGLLVNTDKTQIVWIGKKRHSKEKIETGKNLIWGSSEFYLLGIQFSVSLDKINKLNFDPIIIKIRELLEKWKKRLLTPLGRITVLKSLILPKFNHLFISLPSPPEKTLKEINSIFLSLSGTTNQIR